MEELCAIRRDMDHKLKDSIADVKRKVSTAQERTIKDNQGYAPYGQHYQDS